MDAVAYGARPALEVVLGAVHVGGKFGDGGAYNVSGGPEGDRVSPMAERRRTSL